MKNFHQVLKGGLGPQKRPLDGEMITDLWCILTFKHGEVLHRWIAAK